MKLTRAARVSALASAAIISLSGRPAPAQVVPPPVHPPAAVSVPIVLPHAPPPLGGTSSALFAAQLAIARAQAIDPQAAQTASFAYAKAVQQYRSGNFAGANISALQALSAASQAQVQPAPAGVPAPALVPAMPQLPGLAGGLYGADAAAIDADSFLALARGTLDDCAARHDRRLAGAQAHYARAERDFALRNWQATRVDAKAAIDACAKPQPTP